MSSPFQKAFSAKSPLKNENELSAYKGVDPVDIPGYDDGAGGFDEEANAEFDRMKYITDANIKKGAWVDLGIIKNKSK